MRKGSKHKIESIEKIHISKINCVPWNKGKKTGQIPWNRGIGFYISGKNNPNWKGGITSQNKLLRVSSNWRIWRELVFQRDNFTCQNLNCEFCENKQGVFLHPHHIKPLSLYPELIFKVSNGITYCKDYHLKTGMHRNLGDIKNG